MQTLSSDAHQNLPTWGQPNKLRVNTPLLSPVAVGAGPANIATYLRLEILSERHSGANDAAEVEDGPEDGNVLALLAFRRIREHERALSRPKQAGANA